jgi:hypothetical protein
LLRGGEREGGTHVNDTASAARPMPENLLRKPTSGAHDSATIITFGTRRSTLLEPVVRGMPSMKDIMAALVIFFRERRGTGGMKNAIRNRREAPSYEARYLRTLSKRVFEGGILL